MNKKILLSVLMALLSFFGGVYVFIAAFLALVLIKVEGLHLKIFRPFLLVGALCLSGVFIFSGLAFGFLIMGLRGFVIFTASLAISRQADLGRFRGFLEFIFGRKLSLSLRVALNIFSFFEANLKSIFLSFFLKGYGKRFAGAAIAFPAVVFIHAVRAADEIAKGLVLKRMKRRVLILSAGKHSGKTTLATRLAQDLKTRGLKVGGILSPGYFDNGRRSSFDALDIMTGRKVSLSRRRKESFIPPSRIPCLLNAWMESGIQPLRRISALLKCAGAHYLDSTDVSPWSFNFYRRGLNFCRKAFNRCIRKDVDLIIFDEIGPLELKGRGHFHSLSKTLEQSDSCLLLVVREDLVNAVVEKFDIACYEVFCLGDCSRLLSTCLMLKGFEQAESGVPMLESPVLNSASF